MRITALLGVLATLALAVNPPAGGRRQAAVVFDRTFFCETALIGGIHELSARAHRGTRRAGSQWHRPAFAGVTSGKIGDIASILDNHLVWIVAGRAASDAFVVELPYTTTGFRVRDWGTLAWNTRRCRATSRPLSLSTRGLQGGLAGPFDDEYDCTTPRRVVVRVRATLQRPAAPKRNRRFTSIKVPLTEARLVVATESGRRLLHAEVLASGKARVFTAESCFRG
jgi:hypothetical protein